MTDIPAERKALDAVGLNIVTREEWDAREDYESDRAVTHPATGFVLHISVTADPLDTREAEYAAFRGVEAIGQQRFGIGVSYNALVTDTGTLAEGQPLSRRGAHTVDNRGVFGVVDRSLNGVFRAIALVQNVSDDVTDAQVDQIARWGAAQKLAGYAHPDAQWYGHRDFAYKACPGDTGYLRLPEIRQLTAHYVATGLQGDDAMSAADVEALKKHIDSRIKQAVQFGSLTLTNSFFDPTDPGNEWMLAAQPVRSSRLIKGNAPGTAWYVTDGLHKAEVVGHDYADWLCATFGVEHNGRDSAGHVRPFLVEPGWAEQIGA